MRADRSPSTQPLPMTMGCDRQEHTEDVVDRLTVVGENIDTRGYERAVSDRQQVRLRAMLAEPAHLPADSHTKASQHSIV
eukprot:scaffold114811_cov80-Phaeocystis_antarctica.AAC.1